MRLDVRSKKLVNFLDNFQTDWDMVPVPVPVEGQKLVAKVDTSHALVVGCNESRAGNVDVGLGFLVPTPDLKKKSFKTFFLSCCHL
jgi:hypothetical protein